MPPSAQSKRSHRTVKRRNTRTASDFSHLEGPWPRMPKELVKAIKQHLKDGGRDDFTSTLWRHLKSLDYVRPGIRARFELQGIPDISLVAGRFSYKNNRQIVVVGIPSGIAEEKVTPMIVIFQPQNILDPNGHRDCYGYVWSIWESDYVLDADHERPTRTIIRVCCPTKSTVSDEHSGPALSASRSNGKEQDVTSSHDISLAKRHELVLQVGNKDLAPFQSATTKYVSQDVSAQDSSNSSRDVYTADVSMVDHGIGTSALDSSDTIVVRRPTSESAAAVLKDRDETRASKVDAAARIRLTANTSAFEHAESEYTESEDEGPDSRRPNTETASTANPSSVTTSIKTTQLNNIDNPDGHSLSSSVAQTAAVKPIEHVQQEAIIDLTDDDEVMVKRERPVLLGTMAASTTLNSRNDRIPHPTYPSIASYPDPFASLSFPRWFGSSSALPRPKDNKTSASQDPYKNVKIEFLDAAGIVRDEQPFNQCSSAQYLFDAAFEAETIGVNARMFIIQIGAGRETRMRAGVQQSFQKKLLEPLNEIIGGESHATVTVQVRGLAYLRD